MKSVEQMRFVEHNDKNVQPNGAYLRVEQGFLFNNRVQQKQLNPMLNKKRKQNKPEDKP